MDGYVVHGGMGMARGSFTRIQDGRGILVYVWEGELWITQEGDRRDYLVRGGEWFRVDRNGSALLHATRRTHATLTAPTPADYAQRITVKPAGTKEERVLYERSPESRAWLRGWMNSLSFR